MASRAEIEKREKTPIAFGSSQKKRPLLPDELPRSRLGPDAYWKSYIKVGPGSYNLDPITSSYYEQLKRISTNNKGWGFGLRTSSRFARSWLPISPSPTKYQPDQSDLRIFKPCAKPFNSGSTRFKKEQKMTHLTPGPGHYLHDVEMNKRVQVQGTFGGPQFVIQPVVIKCVIEKTDKCDKCGNFPFGDYMQFRKEILCKTCHQKSLAQCTDAQMRRHLNEFVTVRDCSFMHEHQGQPMATQIISDAQLRKMQRREAYLSLFF